MLKHLYISQYALIDALELDLADDFYRNCTFDGLVNPGIDVLEREAL